MNIFLLNKDSNAAMSLMAKISKATFAADGCIIKVTKKELNVINSGDLIVIREHPEVARYKKALENIAEYVPYAYAQELAKNGLDLEAKMIRVPAPVYNSSDTKEEETPNGAV
jgi:hypothetical protein